MKINKLFFGIILVLNIAKANAGEALLELQKLMQNISAIEANYTQETVSHKQVLQSTFGKLKLLKPKFFKLDIIEPNPSSIISNGKVVWNYEPDLEQVIVQPLNEFSDIPIAMLLEDPTKLEKFFEITLLPNKNGKCLKTSDACFVLKAKSDDKNFKKIMLGFKNTMLHELWFWDQLGQSSKLFFSELKTNSKLSPQQFNFTPPPGTDVIGEED